MKHPFVEDLSQKTLEELQTIISSLNNKLSVAYRMGNQSLINQMNMVIESYRDEYNNKMNELINKQKIQNNINITKNL